MPRQQFIQDITTPYSISARCINKDWFLLDINDVWRIMEEQLYFLHHGFAIKIHAFTLMSNHFHLLATAPNGNLSAGVGYFMRETSRSITRLSTRINQTYGGRFHRCRISNDLHYMHAYKYIYRNPVKAGLAKYVESYRYSTLNGLLGYSQLIIPTENDTLLFEDIEGTLKWLNTNPANEDWETIRNSLRKGEFKISNLKQIRNRLNNNAL